MAEKKKEQPQMNENLAVYEQARQVPESALREITNGRLKGKSDINPMYRIKRITEIFGPCGFGWRYEIVNQWLETYGNQVKAFTQINLFVKMNGEWSEAIPGIGGADFVAQESKGPYVNDECYKMSLTDALSVAMKALGIAADVFWQRDSLSDSKYSRANQPQQAQPQPQPQQPKPQPATSLFNDVDEEAELKAEADALAAESSVELTALWNKYKHINPAYTKVGSIFYKAVQKRGQQLKAEGK